jgi:hypothetical protein
VKIRILFRIALVLLIVGVVAAFGGIVFLRTHAIAACDSSESEWHPTTPSTLAPEGWSAVIRRARLDYLVSPLDGSNRFLHFHSAYRPNDSDVDLLFAPSRFTGDHTLIVYRYNWHLGGWYCKMLIHNGA